MKIKYALLLSALISTSVMAKMITTKSKGADAWSITTLDETTKMSKEEIQEAIKKNDLAPQYMSLQAYAEPITGKVGTNIRLHSKHIACFQNVSKPYLIYGVRFSLSSMGVDIHSSDNNFGLQFGMRRCFNHESFMNVFPLDIGTYKIIAWTVGQEDKEVQTVTDTQPLTVTE